MKSYTTSLQRLGAGIVLTGLAFAAGAGIASAQWYNGPPPPPPRHERVVVREGYVWEAGHWARRDDRWVWMPGHYVAANPGRHWVTGHWRMGPQGRFWVEGHWAG